MGITTTTIGGALALCAASLLLAGCSGDDPPRARWDIVHEGLEGALISVWGSSATDVWVVGGDPPAPDGGEGDGPEVLHWDGTEWTRLHPGVRGDLWWVHGFAEGPVFMGGEDGQILRYEAGAFEIMDTPGTATVFGIWGPNPDDLWAVGGTGASGGGFVWRWDGTAWTDVSIPAEAAAENVFKVWGTAADDVWLVGSAGLLLHWDGSAMELVPSGTTRTIFTVHTRGERVVAVGGLGTGVVLEREPATDRWVDVTPEMTQQMIGVWLTDEGGWAAGVYGAMLRRESGGWVPEDNGFALAESLHAVWVDPEGGVWAVGGMVLAEPLVHGLLLHRGEREIGNAIREE